MYRSAYLVLIVAAVLITNPSAGQHLPSAYTSNSEVNYIRTWNAMAPEANSNILVDRPLRDVRQVTKYFDGLGRPLQTVVKQCALKTDPQNPTSSADAVDLVSPIEYDQYGREVYKFLPFAANNADGNTSINDGLFKINPFQQQAAFMQQQYGSQSETYYYGQTFYEPSPLNRVLETYAAGNSWVGSSGQTTEALRRGIKVKYWFNTLTDDVKIWEVADVPGGWGTYSVTGVYPANELYKNVTVNEHSKQVIEFRDKEGRVILKKVQVGSTGDDGTGAGYSNWLCTYYIYDDLNNLRCVVQPRGVQLLGQWSWNMNALSGAILNEQCFRYEYDHRNRLILKKVPGASEVYMVYDARDRLVLTQDANLRAGSPQQWMYTQYDELNRPIATGLWENSNTSAYHASQAANSTTYPDLTGQTFEELTHSFYDDYSWRSQYGNPLSATLNTAHSTYLQSVSNTNWPYPQAVTQSAQLNGMVTGTRTKVLGTSTYLYTVHFYDDKGRLIQTQGSNITEGTDITTTQYSWSGQPLLTVYSQEKAGTNAQTSTIVTQFTYDDLWRLVKTEKKVGNTLVSSGALPQNWTVISETEYDKLGQAITKKIGRKKDENGDYTTDPIETQTYDYNIRGWLLGVNRSQMLTSNGQDNRYFAFDLGYDKLTNASGRNYTTVAFNGNITGMIWKSYGDGIRRKYDFRYDGANRLLRALFEQNDAGSTWGISQADFTLKIGDGTNVTSAYDANGNIKRMQQWGLKVTGPAQIDDMTYNYEPFSNKLKNVVDAFNDTETKLGDFRSSSLYMTALGGTKTNSATDYTYDDNGNLIKDRNKDIGDGGNDGIAYNYLNLPQTVTVRTTAGAVKGTITYTYDAAGNKWKKEVTETGQPTKTTLYIGGLVYENDVLQFIGQEEGRIRFTPATGTEPTALHYDYFLKDHLGNVRMVLTEEQQQDVYPAATLEGDINTATDAAYIENQYYTLDPAKMVNKSEATGIPDYQNNNGNPPYNTNSNSNTTANSQKLYKLAATATANGGVTGLGFSLKVMAGDLVDIWGKSYYFQNNSGQDNYNVPVSGILDGFLNTPAAVAGGKTNSTELNSLTVLTSAISSFLSDPDRDNGGTSTAPKAYVNYLLLDENFRYVSGGFSRVGTANSLKNHYDDAAMQDIAVARNGYLYMYVSNESPVNVFFDNLQVIHTRGPVLEETHYYPFGLTMAGISSKALKLNYAENKYRFNDGTELNTSLEVGLYETNHRLYDPQIGKFVQVDGIAEAFEEVSPYTFSFNNPILLNDPSGLAADTGTNKVNLDPVYVVAKAPPRLDTENGQVLPPRGFFDPMFRGWNGYYVNEDGYLEIDRYTGQLRWEVRVNYMEMPDLGRKRLLKSGTKAVNKWIIYRATKRIKGKLKLYIGKAKNSLKNRYTQKELDEMAVKAIDQLDNIPDNATALGVEQAILVLNGGIGATANVKNAAVKKAYVDAGLKWLNETIPNWKEVFKFQ